MQFVNPEPEGEVALELHTRVPTFDLPATRATDEGLPTLPLPWVLVFIGTGDDAKFFEARKAVELGGVASVTLKSQLEQCRLLIIANVESLDTSSLTRDTKLSEACDELLTPSLAGSGATMPYTDGYLPMSVVHDVPTIGSSTKLGTNENKIVLKRSVAKITVTNNAAGFNLTSATVINAPRQGAYHNLGTEPRDNSDALTSYAMPAVTTPIYLYEARDDEATSVIVLGEYDGHTSYYKLTLREESGGTTLDVLRNHIYNIDIDEVLRPGFASLTEAIASARPSNGDIVWSVEVTDGHAHDMVDNGEYYLGVSNSEYILYADGVQSGRLAFVVTSNAASTYTISATASGAGLSASASSGSEGGVRKHNVTVGMTEAFTTDTEGSVTVRIGNLVKTVKVSRRNAVAGARPYLEFDDTEYVAAAIDSGGDWLRLSTDKEDTDNIRRINQQEGPIYIHPEANYGDGSSPREAVVYLSRHDNNPTLGRVRVEMVQKVAIEARPPADNAIGMAGAYVGTFHRAKQMGERLLRVPISTANSGAWRAEVIDGKDFIVLDDNFPASLPGDTNAESNQLGGDAGLWVEDNAANFSGNEIRFRLGLTDVLDAPTSTPRYGRVIVSYAGHEKYYFVYVRQGEEPDYLIPYEGRTAGNVRFSPYNTTVRNGNSATTTPTALSGDKYQISLPGSSTLPVSDFVDYPTKAGAQFQFAPAKVGDRQVGFDPATIDFRRWAYNPTAYSNSGMVPPPAVSRPALPSGTSFWPRYNAGNYDVATMETCPPNYRRPTAGTSGNQTTEEFKNSLFVNAAIADGSSDLGNSIWGYYADGYFDRYQLSSQQASATNRAKYAAVNAGTNGWDVAYAGQLFFDDEFGTNASIFFPGAGQRHHHGFLIWPGYGYYWSSSAIRDPETNGKYAETGEDILEYSSLVMSFTTPIITGDNDEISIYEGCYPARSLIRSFGASIRCVACPPMTGSASVAVTWDGTYSTSNVKNNGRFLFQATLNGLSTVGSKPYHWEYLYNNVWRDFSASSLAYTATGESRFAPSDNGRYKFRVTIDVENCGQKTTVVAETNTWEYTYKPNTGGTVTEIE
jgi:hypothetical protein